MSTIRARINFWAKAFVWWRRVLDVSVEISIRAARIGSCAVILGPAAIAAEVVTFAGTGQKGFSGDGGPAVNAQLNNPFAVTRGPDGAIYICDVDNDRIRRVDREGIIRTYAGNGRRGYSGDGGPAEEASLNQPYELAWDASHNLYFVEIGNHVVRKIDTQTQTISTIAGSGVAGFEGDEGPAIQAKMNQPHSLAFGPDQRLYVCDILNHRIRVIDLRTGNIATWSGTGERTTSPDGTAIQAAALHGPRALAFDAKGIMWLALREGNALMKLDPLANTITRIAGDGRSGFRGNGGPALQASLAGPKCVSLDSAGNIYLADTESHSIRKFVSATNTIEVLVGDGTKGDGPDGNDPLRCRLARPHGVFLDSNGEVFIGDSENHRIRLWKP